MSSQLVKRLLRTTTEEAAEQPSPKRLRRRHKTPTAATTLASPEQIMASRARTLLYLDGNPAKNDTRKNAQSKSSSHTRKPMTSQRLLAQRQQAQTTPPPPQAIVTNARSTALQNTTPHLPTHNKQAHERQRKAKALVKLAGKLRHVSSSKTRRNKESHDKH